MIRYALLGLVQGLTEFLPVSSSGHLALGGLLLGVESPGLALEAAVHLGTLGAVLLLFRRDLLGLAQGLARDPGARRYVLLLALGTLPIALVGLLLGDVLEGAFASPRAVGAGFLGTAALLALGRVATRRTRREAVNAADALVVGLAQGLALLPGISRSGATVAAGLVRGLRPEAAARFSFLLSIPAIGGASALALARAAGDPGLSLPALAVAFLCAFGSGLLAIRLFLALLRRGILGPFALYCALLGLAALTWGTLTP
ncbi:MAG: undecaprenyl-diphosphate phosphatase [Candidatus Bipolaricaulota bacterium]|nr:undecaprenyl-diphosphate phosphatase [Candidatus Bipolaricaulota bacterium]